LTILYIDTATTAFWNFGDDDPLSINQPHIVRLAFMEVNDGHVVAEYSNLIKVPDGVKVTDGAYLTHGINNYQLQKLGVSLPDALNPLSESVSRVLHEGNEGQLVAFSWQFHRHVLDISYRRCGFHIRPWSTPIYDVMNKGAPLVGKQHQRPGKGFAFPKFDELSMKALGAVLRPTHNPKLDGLTRVRALLTMHDSCIEWWNQHGDEC